MRLKQLGDFDHRAMNDRIGDGGAEQGSLELSRFREIVRPLAARLWESEVGACRHDPGRLEHRGDLAINSACTAAIGSGSATAWDSTSCSTRACLAAEDMPWAWIGLKRQNESATGSTPRGR